MNLSEILGSLKRDHQTVARPHNGTQVSGQLFGVHLPNFNLKILIFKQNQIFKISYFHKLYWSFQKNYLSPNIPKNHQKIYQTAQNTDHVRWAWRFLVSFAAVFWDVSQSSPKNGCNGD